MHIEFDSAGIGNDILGRGVVYRRLCAWAREHNKDVGIGTDNLNLHLYITFSEESDFTYFLLTWTFHEHEEWMRPKICT